MVEVQRGRLRLPDSAPQRGEWVEAVTVVSGAVVEQILSGELDAPAEYLQDHDEWVVVLAGGATLVVDGTTIDLSAGEWLLLPRGVPHRLESTAPGTSWLAVRGTDRTDAGGRAVSILGEATAALATPSPLSRSEPEPEPE